MVKQAPQPPFPAAHLPHDWWTVDGCASIRPPAHTPTPTYMCCCGHNSRMNQHPCNRDSNSQTTQHNIGLAAHWSHAASVAGRCERSLACTSWSTPRVRQCSSLQAADAATHVTPKSGSAGCTVPGVSSARPTAWLGGCLGGRRQGLGHQVLTHLHSNAHKAIQDPSRHPARAQRPSTTCMKQGFTILNDQA